MNRRDCLAAIGGALACGAQTPGSSARWPARLVRQITERLDALRMPEGGYRWESENEPHVTPTFAVVGIYRVIGAELPGRDKLIGFLSDKYPVPERRRKERPLWTFDFQQVQALRWLGTDTAKFRPLAETWTAPSEFTTTYEAGGNPVFQFQAAAVRTRALLGIPTDQTAWKRYFSLRRRADGTYNNTPVGEGSDGHVMNTLWGLLAAEALGEKGPQNKDPLVGWLQACQGPGGGFRYSPLAELSPIEDAGYTWAALTALRMLGAGPRDPEKAIAFLGALRDGDGLWRETADGRPNPMGTFYALESYAALGHVPTALTTGPAVRKRPAVPTGHRVWTTQIQAPGKGSPEEAVTIAEAAGVHIWAAKNTEPGWIEAAQAAANRRRVPVLFAVGNEEYNTFVTVPGLGTYSHLADLCAPAGKNIGEPMAGKVPRPWPTFRDKRIGALKDGGGRMVWQFNENEELTRILLDEAVARRSYAAICTFHFGNENFLHSQPYLHRWYGRLPMVALQDAHHAESWWGAEQVSGFRTLFLAREPTWEAWLTALDRDWVMGVRRDEVTRGVLRLAGGLPEVRDFVMGRKEDWQWWSEASPWPRRPLASVVVLRPGSRFEAGTPKEGTAVRVRVAGHHTPQGLPRETMAELVALMVDGKPVTAELTESKGPQGAVNDRYYLAPLPGLARGEHTAVARVRDLAAKTETAFTVRWTEV